MQVAICGYAGSGKSELFQALSGAGFRAENRAVVKVPESRLDPLADLFKPRKVVQAEIEFLDIPGGGGKGKGLGQWVLNQIRPHDCLLILLEAFSGESDPLQQREDLETDLLITDLAVIEKRLQKLEMDKKKSKNLVNPKEEELLRQGAGLLEQGVPLRQEVNLCQAHEFSGFQFLSAKPVLYVWNVTEKGLGSTRLPRDKDREAHLELCAKLERELSELDEQEQKEFLAELGLGSSALSKVISKAYSLLGLITFFTGGEKEVRAWPIPAGSNAWETAGEIHSDMQRGFIRAEVLAWNDFVELKSMKKAKEKGVLRLEGRDYIVQDGDIVTFRYNV